MPYGVPSERLRRDKRAPKGVVPGIERDDRVLLWNGGITDWNDPVTRWPNWRGGGRR